MVSKRSVTVAVAGTNGIGGHIIDYLVDEKKHNVVALSRKEQPELTKRGVDVRVVDYENIESLKNALKGVHTAISALGYIPGPSSSNLVRAADEVGVKRFIPSEYAGDVKANPVPVPLMAFKVEPRELTQKSKMEYTLVCNGLFMDYLLPNGAKKHLKDIAMPVNIPDRKADIPGTGNASFTLTTADDVAHAIGELLHIADGGWENYTYISGENVSWNKVINVAEKVIGTKFDIVYRSEDQIKRALEEAVAAGDVWGQFRAGVALGYTQNSDFPRSSSVNNFHYTSVEEFVNSAYSRK